MHKVISLGLQYEMTHDSGFHCLCKKQKDFKHNKKKNYYSNVTSLQGSHEFTKC